MNCARAMRIAGPPPFGGAAPSATMPRAAVRGARAAGPPAANTATRARRPLQ